MTRLSGTPSNQRRMGMLISVAVLSQLNGWRPEKFRQCIPRNPVAST